MSPDPWQCYGEMGTAPFSWNGSSMCSKSGLVATRSWTIAPCASKSAHGDGRTQAVDANACKQVAARQFVVIAEDSHAVDRSQSALSVNPVEH